MSIDTPAPLPVANPIGKVGRVALDWRSIVLVAVIAILVYQIVVPFGMIIWTSLKAVRPGHPDFLTFGFTLDNYVRALGGWPFWSATFDTLMFAGASTLLSFAFGAYLAWVVHRTNTPFSRIIGMMVIARMIVPTVLITVSWILLASPRIGILNTFLKDIFGNTFQINIYSFGGMVWVQAIELVSLSYLLLAAAFQAMDPRLEEASIMTGAGVWRTLRRISLPLAMPAVAASLLLLFVITVDTFEVPALMGNRAGVRVYAGEIYANTARTPTDWGLASSYSVAMLVLSIGLLLLYFRVVRHGEKYHTVTGKDFRPRKIDLGAWRYVTCATSLLLVFLIVGAPFLVMLYVSFLPIYRPPSLDVLAGMTTKNYTELLINTQGLVPLLNSTLVGIGSATVVVGLAALISYFVHKSRVPGRRILDVLGFAAIAIPSIVLGVAFMWFYLLVPIPIIGTLTIIGLAYITKYIPFALRFVSTSMIQIHPELEEAAQVAGVPWWRNFTKVLLPLLKPGLLAAWFWVMVHAYRELTVALILARSENRTAAVVIFDLWEHGSFQKLSAFGVLMFVVLACLVGASEAVSKRYGVSERH